MKRNHTPGPLTVDKSGRVIVVSPRKGFRPTKTNPVFVTAQCSVYCTPSPEEAKANAVLYSAAPDLLDALEAMQRAFEQLAPGLAHIACQDYAIVNEAPILAAKAVAKATRQQ